MHVQCPTCSNIHVPHSQALPALVFNIADRKNGRGELGRGYYLYLYRQTKKKVFILKIALCCNILALYSSV